MVCVYCKQPTKVTNTRPRRTGWSIWRRRWCQKCQLSFTTLENMSVASAIAIKSPQGHLQPANYSQIFISLYKALGNTQKDIEEAEYLTLNVIDKLFKQQQAILTTSFVKQQIFETLNSYQTKAGQRYLLEEMDD